MSFDIFFMAVSKAFGREVCPRGFKGLALSNRVKALIQGGCAAGSAVRINDPSISKSHVFGIKVIRSPRDVCVWVPVLGHVLWMMCFPVIFKISASGRKGTFVKNLWSSEGGP